MSADRRVRRFSEPPSVVPTWSKRDSRVFLARHLAKTDMAELGSLLDQCTRLLENPAGWLTEVTDFVTASRALARASGEIQAALGGNKRAAEGVMASDSIQDLARRIAELERTVAHAEVRYVNTSMHAVREALRQLEGSATVSELLRVAPPAIASIGFDRTLFSHLEQATWLTDAAHVDGDETWADLIVSAGRDAPIQVMAGLPETVVVRRKKPIVVTGVSTLTSVHQAVVEASASRSYVAAPIVVHSDVVGFIHADRCYHRGDVSESDAEVIGVFAQGYSFALEAALARRDIDEFRLRIRSFAQGIDDHLAHGEVRPFSAAELADRSQQEEWRASSVNSGAAASAALRELTRRELEVLDRMALGEGNLAIARKLVISEETVKSHVKSVLRKLAVSNRVEAIAKLHAAQNDRSTSALPGRS
jgi:DNA-binding CsgD family transcriptional regulator